MEAASHLIIGSGVSKYLERQRYLQRIGFALLWGTAGITMGILAVVLGYVFIHGLPSLSWDLLTTPPAGGLSGEGGLSTAILTTLYLVGLTIAIAGPLGIGAGIYMSEYAPANAATGAIRFGVEMLAGVPSIVFGLFGYSLFVSRLHFGYSILSASLATGALILPVVIRTSEEALRAVPMDQREASLALGTTKWQTIAGVVLPSALPGIITGIILSVGRIVSETAVLYVTLGGSHLAPRNIMDGGRTLALHLFYLASETNAAPSKVMATGVVLVTLVLLINLTTNLIMSRWKATVS